MIADRERKIRRELKDIVNRRTVQRKSREGFPVIAIVGYTNAGSGSPNALPLIIW